MKNNKDKYPISREFGLYKLYRIPFSDSFFRNADAIMSILPKTLKDTRKVHVTTQAIKTYDNQEINIYTFEPKDAEAKRVFLYVHGGAFVYRGAKNHYLLCMKFAERAKCKVVYVDYRLAYKYKYPTPVEDAYSAYNYILKNMKKDQKLIIGGDSAGGCLAVDVVRKAHKLKKKLPDFLMLFYPVLDKRMNTKSMKEFVDTPVWNSELNKKMWDLYLKNVKNYTSPGEMEDVSFIPKTYIETAEYDCLHDEAIEFARKLRKQNVKVIVNQTKKTMHGFDVKNGKITQEVVNKRMEILNKIK